jgi:hypothetical protein
MHGKSRMRTLGATLMLTLTGPTATLALAQIGAHPPTEKTHVGPQAGGVGAYSSAAKADALKTRPGKASAGKNDSETHNSNGMGMDAGGSHITK